MTVVRGKHVKKKQRKRYNIEQYQCEKENTRSNYIILYSMIDIIIMSSWSCVYTHTLREYRTHVVIIYYIHVFFFLLNSYRYSCVHTFNVVAVWTVFIFMY